MGRIQWYLNLEDKGDNSGKKTNSWFDKELVDNDLMFSDLRSHQPRYIKYISCQLAIRVEAGPDVSNDRIILPMDWKNNRRAEIMPKWRNNS